MRAGLAQVSRNKETEIKIIRIIMVGKLNNVDTSVIRERVREVYA